MKHNNFYLFGKCGAVCSLLFLLTLAGCSSAENNTTAESTTEQEAAAPTTKTLADKDAFLAPQYLEETTIQSLNKIKEVFDAGISEGFGDRPPAYVYEQHAIRMRMDYFDDDPYTSVFPYNGEFDLAGLTETVAKLPFMSDKCGFQNPTTQEIINYYCFNTNPAFMQYLAAVGESSGMIKRFQERYQQTKNIDADMRQAMLTQSIEEIDFSSPDQQYFYLLFHIVVNEERLALEKLQAQME